MSNKTEFFLAEQKQLTIPAATTSILLDGRLCPFLELKTISRAGNPEFSRARLRYNPAGHPQAAIVRAEDIETILAMGQSIRIEQLVNTGSPEVAALTVPVFNGQIESIETTIDEGGESIEVIAEDISAKLKRITIFGRRIKNNGATIFLEGLETIFNADGKANASAEPAQNEGKTYTMFSAEPGQGKFWSYAEVIAYLLNEYLPAGELEIPSVSQTESLTQSQTVRDLDVTGLSLMEAIEQCCLQTGLRFRFAPRPGPESTAEAIIFYRPATGRTVELNCQQKGEQINISQTDIYTLHSKRNFWPVTHRYIGQGDFKVFEATFELVGAWDPALEDTDYEKYSPRTNENFQQARDVYRKWCLNEAGDYSGEPYNRGEAFDFSRIFESNNFVHHRRRFWPTLSCDKAGRSLGYVLQISYDDGEHWWQYLHAFDTLLNECGIWLSGEQLDADTWFAVLKGVLKFRLTASVVGDERLTRTMADGPVNSLADTIDHVITLPQKFKYRKVSTESIFASSTDENIGKPDEIDDSAALGGYVRRLAESSSAVIETIEVKTPYLAFDYRPGDKIVTSPESRDIFCGKLDNRSIHWVERVDMDFVGQCTNLKILRRRQ
jgi:hypothetical protein